MQTQEKFAVGLDHEGLGIPAANAAGQAGAPDVLPMQRRPGKVADRLALALFYA